MGVLSRNQRKRKKSESRALLGPRASRSACWWAGTFGIANTPATRKGKTDKVDKPLTIDHPLAMRVLCGVERSMVAMFAIGTAAGVGVRVGGNAAWAEPEELHKQVHVSETLCYQCVLLPVCPP